MTIRAGMTTRAITETTTGEHWVAVRGQAVVETTTLKTTRGIVTTIRKTRGDDIDAACGQLAGRVQDRTKRKLGSRIAVVVTR